MSTVASRDLRNHTGAVLRQVASGTPVTITVNGTAVAEITAVRAAKPTFLSKADVATVLQAQADPGLTQELAMLAGETTDDLETS